MADQTASNIVKAVDAKTNPPKSDKPEVILKNQENGGVEIKDPNAGKEKYIVDGKERYLTPEEARAYVQKGLAFEPRMDQLGRLQQETAAFLDTLSKTPVKLFIMRNLVNRTKF